MYIYDGNNIELDKQTGNIIPETIKSPTSHVRIQFTTDHMGTRTGFKIEIQFVPAGKYYPMYRYLYMVYHKNGTK